MGDLRRVATDKSGYANERNITGLPFRRYAVSRAPNLYRLPNYLYFRATGRSHPYWSNLHRDLGLGGYDVLHFFNGLSLGRKPWFSTFETYLPRWGSYGGQRLEWGLKLMAGSACKGLFALSDCTARFQEAFLADFPAYRDEVMAKVSVLHPPQPLLLEDFSTKNTSPDFIDCCLVGADFFRKGGLETLRVMDRLIAEGLPLRLYIVSAMNTGDYASRAGPADLAEAQRLIQKHPGRIFHHERLPYAGVLDLFRACDVGLLPTWADTYGYTVLEAQAAGCPVITTNVRALPEINPESAGWQLEMPLDERGNAVIGSEPERRAFSNSLEEQLDGCLREVAGLPAEIKRRGRAAWMRVKEQHDPAAAAERLEFIYDSVLGK